MKLPSQKPTSQAIVPPGTGKNPVRPGGTSDKGAIIREKALGEETGLSRTTRWRLRQRGEFPRPIRLGPNSIGYLRVEVERWLSERDRA